MKSVYGFVCLMGVLLSSMAYGKEEAVALPVRSAKMPLVMIRVRGGEYQMGSPSSEAYRRPNESRHTVVLKDFLLSKFEVTQEQWVALMGENPSKHVGEANLPVENVSWEDAMAFCKALTKDYRQKGALKSNQHFTLPTEAQWEVACRAGKDAAFGLGATLDGTQANFDGNHPYGKSDKSPKYVNATVPVGSYQPNGWGFMDMHGNVMEWCRDWYVEDLGTVKAVEPKGAKEGTYKVYRGGNYRDIGAFCRSAFRYFNLPHFRYGYLGFRVALVEE